MPAGGFLEQKPKSPGSLAAVIALHAAAIGALALSKTEVVRNTFDRIKVVDVKKDDPPPPEKPPEPKQQPQQQPEQITWAKPVVELPTPTPIPAPPLPTVPPPTHSLPGPEIIADPAPKVELPPPPPPPLPGKTESARARANLASYVSAADYPSSALRNEEQGTTRFRLTVGPDGRVADCTITSSSGSSALDATTCRLMKSRARFVPARDSEGQPVADTATSAVRWVLPEG